jgi:hypothetical protein
LSQAAVDCCRWLEPGGLAAARVIAAFLEGIGIEFEQGPTDASVLPGMTVADGRVRVDPSVPAYPGDLLHEAGHLAVCDPVLRASIKKIDDDPAEEMAAIAWSVAAARACGLGLEVLFHDGGYKGGAQSLRTAFAEGPGLGVPMLAWYGMTAEPHRAAERGMQPFPAMVRWLR